jgi:hypothetical protein
VATAIRALTRQQFDRFISAQPMLADFLSRSVEWFIDDGGVILGAVTHHDSELKWSYVVLTRDPSGTFRPCHLELGVWNVDEARSLLLSTIETRLRMARSVTSKREHERVGDSSDIGAADGDRTGRWGRIDSGDGRRV